MKGRRVFVIPGCLRERDVSIGMKRAPKERDQAVETEEHGRRAVNGQVRPLALGLDPQMGPALLESRFQAPAFHERAHDPLRSLRLVRRKERFGWPFPLRITRENPTNGQGVKARAIPQSSPCADLQGAFAFSIPVQGQALPRRVWIDQDRFERGEAEANHPRTTDRMCIAFWRRVMQDRIQMKRGDEGDLLLLTVQTQFQDAVGGIAQECDRQSGKPAAHQLHHLTRPHADRLVAFAQARAYLWCGRQHTQKGQGTALVSPGQGDNYGHDEEAAAPDYSPIVCGWRARYRGNVPVC